MMTPLGPQPPPRAAAEPGTIVTESSLNHEFLMSSYHTASERALAWRALELHPGQGLDVLVGGLGLGYTAREALVSQRVARVTVVEFLPQVIAWLDRDLVPLVGAQGRCAPQGGPGRRLPAACAGAGGPA